MLTKGRVRLEEDGEEAVASASAPSGLQLLGSTLTGLIVVVLPVVVNPLAGANWTGPLAARNCR
jgi:hypothetical protein